MESHIEHNVATKLAITGLVDQLVQHHHQGCEFVPLSADFFFHPVIYVSSITVYRVQSKLLYILKYIVTRCYYISSYAW